MSRSLLGALHDLHAGARRELVHDHAFHRVDLGLPRRALDHTLRVGDAGLPARADAAGREVDVLEVVLAVQRRREKAHDMHEGAAAPRGELAAFRAVLLFAWKLPGELADDVAQAVDLLLARDVAVGAARVLDVLLPAHHLPD